MTEEPQEEPLIPRLLASNALRANLSKHMTLNQMADAKVSMIMTISLTQYDRLAILFGLLGATISALVYRLPL